MFDSKWILASMAACVVAVGAAAQSTAPDGKRGFGADIRTQELLSLFRSAKNEDQLFLTSLDGLATDVSVVAESALARHVARGDVAVLEPDVRPTLTALHERFAELRLEPFDVLVGGGPRAMALARLLVDPRFRARAAVLETFELEVREVRRGLSVVRGVCDGFVQIDANATKSIATRVDLAAAMLRVMRDDLMLLRQTTSDADVDRRARELVELATAAEGEGVRRAGVARELATADKLDEALFVALFTPRLRSRNRALLEWRRRVFEESIPLRELALQFLPDTEAGRNAPDEIKRQSKSDRIRGAGYRATQALVLDPLDDQACWIAAHAADFMYGIAESRPWYDRFLALRGVRTHDHRTISGRNLDAQEREALDAIQRSLLGGMAPRGQ